MTQARFEAAAAAIADHLASAAIRAGGRASWIHSVEVEHALPDGRAQAIAARPWYYDGLAGIAHFLSQASHLLERPDLRDLAVEAMRQALHTSARPAKRPAFSFFCGDLGVAWSAICIGRAAEDRWVEAAGLELLDGVRARKPAEAETDYLLGIAGAIPPLLDLAERGVPRARSLAVSLGDRLVRVARDEGAGVAWDTLPGSLRPLTGLSHGASGIALALATLHRATGDERYKRVALRALVYEDSAYDAQRRNWPDFRKPHGEPRPELPYAVTWCHGAPGIGLARAAIQGLLDGAEVAHLGDAAQTTSAALEAGLTDPETPYQICHGAAGLALALDEMAAATGDVARASGLVRAVAERGLALHGHEEGWTDGTFSQWLTARPGLFDASLMTGLAGTGAFYLRSAHGAPAGQPALAPGSLVARYGDIA